MLPSSLQWLGKSCSTPVLLLTDEAASSPCTPGPCLQHLTRHHAVQGQAFWLPAMKSHVLYAQPVGTEMKISTLFCNVSPQSTHPELRPCCPELGIPKGCAAPQTHKASRNSMLKAFYFILLALSFQASRQYLGKPKLQRLRIYF